jgi:hypothetical protein
MTVSSIFNHGFDLYTLFLASNLKDGRQGAMNKGINIYGEVTFPDDILKSI